MTAGSGMLLAAHGVPEVPGGGAGAAEVPGAISAAVLLTARCATRIPFREHPYALIAGVFGDGVAVIETEDCLIFHRPVSPGGHGANPAATRLAVWAGWEPAEGAGAVAVLHGPVLVTGRDGSGRPCAAPDWLVDAAGQALASTSAP